MLLEVRHVTRYQYDEPVRESVMEVWMQPQKRPGQRLVSFDLDLDPPAQLFSFADTFGNAVYHFDIPQPHQELTITARSAVETESPDALPEALDRGEWDRLRARLQYADTEEVLAHGPSAVVADVLDECAAVHRAFYNTFVAYPLEHRLPA